MPLSSDLFGLQFVSGGFSMPLSSDFWCEFFVQNIFFDATICRLFGLNFAQNI